MANPYVIDGIVKAPEMFFGRRTHLRRLLRHVREMDCVAVIGPPGIGKSSLLYQLTQQKGLQETHLALYFDLSQAPLQDTQAFLRKVIGELGHRTGRVLVGSSVDRLEQALATLRDEEKLNVLLCLDELDRFASEATEADALLEGLRRLGFARLLSIVGAFARPLAELTRERVISHRFVRLFDERMDLGLLSAVEADRLIREPAGRKGVEFPPEALELARELGGRHPLYLQLAGYHLFEALSSGEEVDLEAVRDRFAEAAFPHFHRLWASLTPQEREAVRYYADVLSARPPDVKVRQALITKGAIERRGGAYRPFSEHLRQVVRQQRQRLEEPLPVPEEPSAPSRAQAAPVEEAAEAPVAAQEVAVAEAPTAPVEEPIRPEAEAAPAETRPMEAVEVAEPSDALSSQEASSLAALGCYVLAITLDFLFIVGIVVARALFHLPTREMYMLVGVAAVLPILVLLLNRLSGDLWVRLFSRLIQPRRK